MSSAQALARKSPADLARSVLNKSADARQLFADINDLVLVSYASHPVRHRTKDEDKRRVKICLDAFTMMRKEKGFSFSRALAMIPHAFKHAMEHPNQPWEPPAEQRLYRVG